MSDWKPYAVQATLGTMKLLVISCSRSVRWRLSTHSTPGTKGDMKRHHGRQSYADQITVLLTVPEVDQIIQLANRTAPITWTHPLLPPITGYVENLEIPADSGRYGYFLSTFTVVEAYDRAVAQSKQPGVPSTASSKAKANSLYNDFMNDMDGLDDIPTDNSGTSFTDSFGDMNDAFGDVNDAFDSITDPAGDGTWRDLSRTLDVFGDTVDTFIDAAREIESSLENAAYTIQTAPVLVKEVIGEAVDNLKASADAVASFVTTEPSDIFSMMADAGIEMTEANIIAIMEDNNITDPLAINPGSTIAIQVKN